MTCFSSSMTNFKFRKTTHSYKIKIALEDKLHKEETVMSFIIHQNMLAYRCSNELEDKWA